MPGTLRLRLGALFGHDSVALVPGAVVVVLMLVWAVEDGGYDQSTWYWGALVVLSMFGATALIAFRSARPRRGVLIALGAFAGYVAWSYLSITWAGSKGDALDGSNRALLYLLVFGVMALLPWTPKAALAALTAFALGVGAIGIVLLARLSSDDRVPSLLIAGRLAAPTGYINATAALFTLAALVATGLASRRELPAELRGLVLATACADLQLAVIVQSRGWLFTLPLVLVAAAAIVRDRLRIVAVAVLPIAGTLIPLHRLLDVFKGAEGNYLHQAAPRGGTAALIACAVVLVLGTVIGWAERLRKPRPMGDTARRVVGTAVLTLALAAFAGGGIAATHGHPFAFIKRQWSGFSHQTVHYSTQSHFLDIGSGRYDFWRVALDAFLAHPIGGLGQDNFGNYYLLHRRIAAEPEWTHSLELRLLAHTGAVGFLLFATFLAAAIGTALRISRRSGGLTAAVTAVALLPLVDWVIHGSLDWFWEVPALTGPALGFLGVAVALGREREASPARSEAPPRPVRLRTVAALAAVIAVCTVVLGLPYLSVRETDVADNIAATNPDTALHDLSTAADLDPLSAEPGRAAGTVALHFHLYATAQASFAQVAARDPGGWFGWFGEGLAASALGDRARAHELFARARSINNRQPIIERALSHVYSRYPVTPTQGLNGIITSD